MTSENSWARQKEGWRGLYRVQPPIVSSSEWILNDSERGRLVEAFWGSAASAAAAAAAATRVVLDRVSCVRNWMGGNCWIHRRRDGLRYQKGPPSLYRHLWDVDAAKPRKRKKKNTIFIAAMSTRLSFDTCRSISFGQAAMEGLFLPFFALFDIIPFTEACL